MKTLLALIVLACIGYTANAQAPTFGVKNNTTCANLEFNVEYKCPGEIPIVYRWTGWNPIPAGPGTGGTAPNSSFGPCSSNFIATRVELRRVGSTSPTAIVSATPPPTPPGPNSTNAVSCTPTGPAAIRIRMMYLNAAEVN